MKFLETDSSLQLSMEQDSSSPAITIPTGLPFDNSVQTQVFVSEAITNNYLNYNKFNALEFLL